MFSKFSPLHPWPIEQPWSRDNTQDLLSFRDCRVEHTSACLRRWCVFVFLCRSTRAFGRVTTAKVNILLYIIFFYAILYCVHRVVCVSCSLVAQTGATLLCTPSQPCSYCVHARNHVVKVAVYAFVQLCRFIELMSCNLCRDCTPIRIYRRHEYLVTCLSEITHYFTLAEFDPRRRRDCARDRRWFTFQLQFEFTVVTFVLFIYLLSLYMCFRVILYCLRVRSI
jgi:hypothetical protein